LVLLVAGDGADYLRTLRHEVGGHVHGLFQQTAAVAAQVQDYARQVGMLGAERVQGGAYVTPGALDELRDADVSGLAVDHSGVRHGTLAYLGAGQGHVND
jgi:hypothetical protein